MWRQLLTQPDQAAHALGKLLSRVGQQRVMWGTDAIWYGSPQAQIMAMRAFQITEQFQEQYAYPALTDDVKAAIFGLNAAHLFGIDADGHALCPDHRSPQRQHRRIGRPARRRGAPLRLVTSWSDHPAPGAELAGLPRHPLDAVLARSCVTRRFSADCRPGMHRRSVRKTCPQPGTLDPDVGRRPQGLSQPNTRMASTSA